MKMRLLHRRHITRLFVTLMTHQVDIVRRHLITPESRGVNLNLLSPGNFFSEKAGVRTLTGA